MKHRSYTPYGKIFGKKKAADSVIASATRTINSLTSQIDNNESLYIDLKSPSGLISQSHNKLFHY